MTWSTGALLAVAVPALLLVRMLGTDAAEEARVGTERGALFLSPPPSAHPRLESPLPRPSRDRVLPDGATWWWGPGVEFEGDTSVEGARDDRGENPGDPVPPPQAPLERPIELGIVVGPYIREHFEPEHWEVMALIRWCESGNDPDAQNPESTAAGWWQILATTWRWAREAGDLPVAPFVEGRYDPEQGTIVAAWLVYEGGGTGHWDPSGGCWQ